jgi:DNA-binding CsgD family transcriptional regulator
MTAMISDSSWITQGTGLAELLDRTEEPTVAVAYALLCGVMVAQGRFGEVWHWLGRAEHTLQPAAEPGIRVDRIAHADLISELLDLLAQPGKPAPTPGSKARREGAQAISEGIGRFGGPLTEGETRVLRYLPTHLCTREIADELTLSANTIKTHIRHLYQKLGAHSRGDAVRRARAFGLLASLPRSG